MIGASVMVQGSSLGTITNVDGRYTLANVPESSTITVSYIGYVTVNYAATSRNLSQVVLREDSKTLEEVSSGGIWYAKESKPDWCRCYRFG